MYSEKELMNNISEKFSSAYDEAVAYGSEWEILAIQCIQTGKCIEAEKCLYRAFADTRDSETIHRVLRLCLYCLKYPSQFQRQAKWCAEKLQSIAPDINISEELEALESIKQAEIKEEKEYEHEWQRIFGTDRSLA